MTPNAESLTFRFYLNLATAYIVLLLLLLMMFLYYVYLLKWLRQDIMVFWELTYPSRGTICYVTLVLFLRFVSGAVHALLLEQPVLQLAILLSIQMVILVASTVVRKRFVSNSHCRCFSRFTSYE